MSIAPPPAYPTWPPQPPYPPAPQPPRRRWPAIAAAIGVGAVTGAVITTLITLAATGPAPVNTTAPTAGTITVTAEPPPPPTPMPAAQADAQTCHAWGTADTLVNAGKAAMGVIPEDMAFNNEAVQNDPTLVASVTRASDLFDQAANTFEVQIAPGTSPMLAQIADTTVSSLHTLSEAYRTFDPASGNVVDAFLETKTALDWLCE